jgi:tetratricopeptide (TPR) repeat protein
MSPPTRSPTEPESQLLLDESEGPALRLSAEEERALISAALRRVSTLHVRPAPRRRGRSWWVGGAVLIASAAAAAVAVRVARQAIPTSTVAEVPPTSPPMVASERESGRDDSTPTQPTPSASLTGSPETGDLQHREPTTGLGQPAPVAKKLGATAPAAVEKVARDRLEQANRLRRDKRYAEALNVYLEVVRDYPQSLQAQAARVAAADLKLEHMHDVDGAQRLYNEAKRQGGAATEEAAYGLAQSYRQRGDIAQEREALQHFIRSYPESPLVASARKRLAALSGD